VTTAPTLSLSSSSLSVAKPDERSPLAVLLEIKKESEALQMELGSGDAVSYCFVYKNNK